MSTPYQPSSPDDPGSHEPRPTYGTPQHDPAGGPDRPDLYGPQPGGYGYPGQGTEPYGGYQGAEPYGAYQGGYGPAPDHPQGVLILVLGILGFFLSGVTSPFAWVLGSRALRDIRATGQHPANEQLIVIGRVLGIIGTVLLVLTVVAVVLAVLLFAVAGTGA